MNAIPGVVRGVEETVGSIDDLVIFGSTKEDSDAGIFMRPFTVAILGFQVEGDTSRNGNLCSAPGDRQGVDGASPLR
jgi:hypothetical protein